VIESLEKKGTWQHATDRLIASLVFILEQTKDLFFPVPIEDINFSDLDLIEKVIDLLEDLKSDILFLQTAKIDLLSWAKVLEELADGYFIYEKTKHLVCFDYP